MPTQDSSALSPPIHPSLLVRRIIHFDMDAFYAAVEIRDDPSLRDKPLVIGGSPQSRAVVCTASYVARRYGVRSAMPCSQAARLCPEAIFLAPNFAKYQQASLAIRQIFAQYTSLIEPLSLDEAYLDVTKLTDTTFATRIARQIQEQIHKELRLTGSAGVAPNKLLAKIASDINKPFGLAVITPDRVLRFMETLPLRKIHGIGPASEKRLSEVGLRFCGDVWRFGREAMIERFGNMGEWIWERAQGIDDREVQVERQQKSIGKEETFSVDLLDIVKLRCELDKLVEALVGSLEKSSLKGKRVTLKCKYSDFSLITRSISLTNHTDRIDIISDCAHKLLSQTLAGQRRIRLLGISISHFVSSESPQQLRLVSN